MLFRSLLFVPGHNEKMMQSAAKLSVDVILPDVEDAVQPLSMKPAARKQIVTCISSGVFAGKRVFPRVNGPESGELLKDLDALAIDGVDGFMFPKAEEGKDIFFFDQLLLAMEMERGFEEGTFKIIPLIETTSAVLNAREICAASTRVEAIAYGCEDFVTDLRGVHDPNAESLFVPRALIAMSARAEGVVPVDTVHVDVMNIPDLRRNLTVAKNLGFEGMLALHPMEISHIHEFFSPTEEEIKKAMLIKQLYEENKQVGSGVVFKENMLIGAPMYKDALKVLERSKKT